MCCRPRSDVDGDPVRYAVGTQPMHGSVTVNPDGTYRYVPAADYNGADSFTYQVTDGQAVSTCTVDHGDRGQRCAGWQQRLDRRRQKTASRRERCRAVDVDGDPLTYLLRNGPSHGVATVLSDGRYTIRPRRQFLWD